ncbi:undecaprenyl-diphosphate phosphatase [Acidobacteriota bacterium]
MSFIEIFLLGIIQGLTEFFPVSSSGHLVLFQNLFGMQEPLLFVDIMLHVGTLLSLFIFLRREIWELLQGFGRLCFNPRKNISGPKTKLIFGLAIASLPTAIIGYFFSAFFESLFSSLRAVGAALLVTGGFLLLTRVAKEKKKAPFLHPVFIGILQGLAIVPGFSRSGLTIGGAILLGWKRSEAAQFSFLLSIPAILGAVFFQFTKIDVVSQAWLPLLVGTLTAAASGYFALFYLVALINKGKFYSFSYYCFMAGFLTIILSFLI